MRDLIVLDPLPADAFEAFKRGVEMRFMDRDMQARMVGDAVLVSVAHKFSIREFMDVSASHDKYLKSS